MGLALNKAIIAVLFYRGEAVTYQEMASLTDSTAEEVLDALHELESVIETVGLSIVRTEDEVELRTGPESSELIEVIRKEELTKDIGKAGLETLSIILYKGPSTRAEIEYVRGVNSTAILRNLLIRGLIEKVSNPKDQRSFLYKPSIELLAHLGLESVQKLPDFGAVRSELEIFESQRGDKTGVV